LGAALAAFRAPTPSASHRPDAHHVNGLAAHVTVHVEPAYDLKQAGAHGEGFTNTGERRNRRNTTRAWEAELDPAGIEDTQPAITKCRPSSTCSWAWNSAEDSTG
jgi:hypothetical protein